MSGVRSNQIPTKRQNSQLSEDDEQEETTSASSQGGPQADYLPGVWDDEVRMNALFTDFRARNVNPAAFDSKMKFWTDVIDSCVAHEELVTFSSTEIRDRLQRKGKKPHCIPKVLEEMHRSRKFVTVDEFFSSAQDSWVAWGFDSLLKKPLSWSAGFIFGTNSMDADKIRFVSPELIKTKAADVLDRAQSGILPSSALDLGTFKEIFGDILSGPSIPIVLKHLQRTQQAVVTDLDDEEHATIKFLQKGTSSRETQKKRATISETDRGVIALRRSLQKMENEAAAIQAKTEELDAEIRSLVRAGKKPVALRVLKKKKLLEKALAQKDVVISNIGNMLFKLENSENDTKVFEAYQTGLAALKKTQQDTSLEKIEGVVDDLHEAVDLHNEISEAIGSPLRGAADEVDEDELEQELKDLLEEDDTGNLIAELQNLKVADSEPSSTSSPVKGLRGSSLKGKTGPSQI